jgi:hypothetical protein
MPLEPSVLYVLAPGVPATLRSDRGAHVMLCGGAPLDGPRHVWWNFVSSRPDRIRQAREDWTQHRLPNRPRRCGADRDPGGSEDGQLSLRTACKVRSSRV